MGMMQEFREFAIKGNVMDLAVGVIIGGAFGKIVDSVVNDLIMPLVGLFFGKLDLNFVILAFIIFMMVKQINRLKREAPAAPEQAPATPEDIQLLREIRDSLNRKT